MSLRKYELERKLGEVYQHIQNLTGELEEKKTSIQNLRVSIQESKKERQIRKLEEEVQKEETELSRIQSELQRAELSYNQLKNEQARIIYPTCSNCGNKGNIFVFQAVATEATIDDFALTENIPTYGAGIVYCIKCGYVVGTVNKSKS